MSVQNLSQWMTTKGDKDIWLEFDYNERNMHSSQLTYGVDTDGSIKKKSKKKKKSRKSRGGRSGTKIDEEFPGPKKKVNLSSIVKVEENKGVKHGFLIFLSEEPPLELAAPSKDVYDEWVDGLGNAIQTMNFAKGKSVENLSGGNSSNRRINDLVQQNNPFFRIREKFQAANYEEKEKRKIQKAG